MRIFTVDETKLKNFYGEEVLKERKVLELLKPYSRDEYLKLFFEFDPLSKVLTSETTFLINGEEKVVIEERNENIYKFYVESQYAGRLRIEYLSIPNESLMRLVRYKKENLKGLLLLHIYDETIDISKEEWCGIELTCFSHFFSKKELISHNLEYIPRFLNLKIVDSLIKFLSIKNLSSVNLKEALEISERFRDDNFGVNMYSTFLPEDVFNNTTVFKNLGIGYREFNLIEQFFNEQESLSAFMKNSDDVLGIYYSSIIKKIKSIQREYSK